MNNVKKNKFGLLEIFAILIFVFCLVYFSRFELYEDKYNFQKDKIIDNSVSAKIEKVKSYQIKTSKNYYVFTDLGKLHISSDDNQFFRDDQNFKIYKDLESKIGQTCTFKVEKNWWFSWQVKKYFDCDI